MQSNYDPETAATVWNSPAYHTTAIKWTSPVTSSLFLEAGLSNNTEYYTNEYREGIEKPRGIGRVVRQRGEERARSRRLHAGRSDQHHREPGGVLLERGGDVGQGRSHHQVRRQQSSGHVQAHARSQRRPGSAVPQQQHGVRWSVPDSVLIRNTPLYYGERLNRDLGIYIQDSWRLNRLTANIGLRWETLNAKVLAGKSPRRPVRAGAHVRRDRRRAGLERLRAAHGAGLRPVRQRPDRHQVLAQPLQPVAHHRDCGQLQPAAAARRRRCRGATSTATTWRTAPMRCTGYPSAACEIDFAGLSANYGIAALNEYGDYPRTWNLESGLEVQHELFGGMSVGGLVVEGRFPQPDDDDQPVVDDRRLHAVHLVQPDHRSAVRGLRAHARGAADPKPRHVRSRTRRTRTSRSTSKAGGAFPAAARSLAASRSSASGTRTAPRPTIRTT